MNKVTSSSFFLYGTCFFLSFQRWKLLHHEPFCLCMVCSLSSQLLCLLFIFHMCTCQSVSFISRGSCKASFLWRRNKWKWHEVTWHEVFRSKTNKDVKTQHKIKSHIKMDARMNHDCLHVFFLPTLNTKLHWHCSVVWIQGKWGLGEIGWFSLFPLNDKKTICCQVCMVRDLPLTKTKHISSSFILLHQKQPRGEGYVGEHLMMCGLNQSISPPLWLSSTR